MMRVTALAGFAVFLTVLLATAVSAAAQDPGAPTPPTGTVDECHDGIDNDDDLLADSVDNPIIYDPDPGCDDGTPLTERLWPVPTLRDRRARRIAKIVADETFGDAYRWRLVGPIVECDRVTRIRFRCELRFIYSRSLYVLRVKPRNTIVDDAVDFDYSYRAFKFTESCLSRKQSLRCATRY